MWRYLEPGEIPEEGDEIFGSSFIRDDKPTWEKITPSGLQYDPKGYHKGYVFRREIKEPSL